MRRTAAAFAITASALLTACGSAPGGGTSPDTAGPATAQPASAAGTAAASEQGAAASLDPCHLVTRAEASSLAGTPFGRGREESDGKNGQKRCIYGYQTTNVFTVELAQGTDPAAARADWAREQARVQSAIKHNLPPGVTLSVNLKGIPGLGDRAATAYATTSLAGQRIGISGIYLLKGATFLAFQDLLLGHAPPSAAAMKAEARRALARVP